MKKVLIAGLFVALCIIVSPAVTAGTLYVDDDYTALTVGWGITHFAHPQDAVNAATAEDNTILVAEGYYGTRYSDCPWAPSCGCGDTNAPALIVYKDDLTIQAIGSAAATIIESTHLCWSNQPAVQRSTNKAVDSIAAPNGVSIISNGVTIDGFTIRSLFAGDPGTNYPNTAGIMIGGLYAGDQNHLGVTDTTVKNCIISGHSGIYNWRASDTIIEGNIVRILASDALPNTVNGNGIVVWDGYFEGIFPPTSTGVQILNNDISTCNVDITQGGEGKGIMFGGTDSTNTDQWNPPVNPLDAQGADQSGMFIDGNTICAASTGIKFWNSLGSDKLITCDNIITFFTYRVHDYGADEGYPESTWTDLYGYCQDGTGTPGYWMTHPEAWPFDSIVVGGESYTKEEAIDLMLHSTKKDVTYIMFQSLVAAKLNVLLVAGFDSSCIMDTITDADAWMAENRVGSKLKAGGRDSPWRTGEPLYLLLDDYNNGLLCAPSRG